MSNLLGDNSVSVSHILAYLANIGTESILLSTTFPRIFVQHYTEIESFFRTERFFFFTSQDNKNNISLWEKVWAYLIAAR